MAVENICLNADELMMMVFSPTNNSFFVSSLRESPHVPLTSFQRMSEIFPLDLGKGKRNDRFVREHSLEIIKSNPNIAHLIDEGYIHALEYGPPEFTGPGAIIFYKLLDKKVLQRWYDSL